MPGAAARGNLTAAVSAFREAARHLWNTSFVPGADWDARDRFSRVCVALFDALVLGPAWIRDARLPDLWESDPDPMPQVLGVPIVECPSLINREIPRCG